MGRIGKISALGMSDDERHLWSEEDEEFVVVTRGGKPSRFFRDEDETAHCMMSFIACVNPATGDISRKTSELSWKFPNDRERPDEYLTFFEPNTVYRIIGRRHRTCDYIYPLKTLEEMDPETAAVKYPPLRKVIEDYRKVQTLQSQVFGQIALNKEMNWYEGEGNWCGEPIRFSFEVEDIRNVRRAMKRTERIFAKAEALDRKMRKAAARELTELADEWQDSDDDDCDEDDEKERPAITGEEFARRLRPSEIAIDPYGEFVFYYEDDNLFFGHAVSVSVSERGSVQQVQMEG